MMRLLGDNVGDHFSAAVDNVLGDGHAHFEQAVFADGLSPASMQQLRGLIGAEWQRLLQAFVPVLERMVQADAAVAETEAARRVRIGLYAYDAEVAPHMASADGSAAPAAARARTPAVPALARPEATAAPAATTLRSTRGAGAPAAAPQALRLDLPCPLPHVFSAGPPPSRS